jgi:hypothetical protein
VNAVMLRVAYPFPIRNRVSSASARTVSV